MNSRDVQIEERGIRLHVKTPFSTDFNANVKGIGGRWTGSDRTWSVPSWRKSDLHDLLVQHFRWDPESTRRWTVRFDLAQVRQGKNWKPHSIRVAGRPIAVRREHDEPVALLVQGLRVVERELPLTGGTRDCPAIAAEPGTIVEWSGVDERTLGDLREWTVGMEIVE